MGQLRNIAGKFIEYDDKGKARVDPKKLGEAQMELVAMSVVDEKGQQIFTATELDALPTSMSEVVGLLFTAANKANPITATEEKNIEKN